MGAIKDFINRKSKLTAADVDVALLSVIKANEASLLDLNIEQLMDGRDANGLMLEPAYSTTTVEYKKAVGQPFDRVTLHDQGDFYRGFFLETNSFPVFFNSHDRKTGKLAEKYGDIFGLDGTSMAKANSDFLKEDVKAVYHNLLFV